MASKKQHAAIDFQGAAKITIAGGAGNDGQVLTSGGSAAMTWENVAAIDDSSAITTDAWSASKIISYLVAFYATKANGFNNHKYTAAIEWERTNAISETGWGQGSGSGSWQANQSWGNQTQTSTTGSGTGALFSVTTDGAGIPTFTWVTGGFDYEAEDTLTFTDPYGLTEVCVLYVSEVTPPSEGVGWTGTTGSMVCTINHELDTEYITMSMRNEDGVLEVGSDWTDSEITVVDEDNITLEYFAPDYPAVGEDKFITIIG